MSVLDGRQVVPGWPCRACQPPEIFRMRGRSKRGSCHTVRPSLNFLAQDEGSSIRSDRTCGTGCQVLKEDGAGHEGRKHNCNWGWSVPP